MPDEKKFPQKTKFHQKMAKISVHILGNLNMICVVLVAVALIGLWESPTMAEAKALPAQGKEFRVHISNIDRWRKDRIAWTYYPIMGMFKFQLITHK